MYLLYEISVIIIFIACLSKSIWSSIGCYIFIIIIHQNLFAICSYNFPFFVFYFGHMLILLSFQIKADITESIQITKEAKQCYHVILSCSFFSFSKDFVGFNAFSLFCKSFHHNLKKYWKLSI